MELRRTPIRKAGVRPLLFLGADRTLAMMLLIGCVTLVLSWDRLAMAVAVVAYPLGIFVLQRVAKADPLALPVVLRHLVYQRYYPARSSAFGRSLQRPTSAFRRTWNPKKWLA